MTDAELRALLRALGIDSRTWRVISVLPLAQVAWADGRIQPAERRRIIEIASEHDVLGGDGRMVLEGWLRFCPTEDYFERGMHALTAIAERGGLRSCGMSSTELMDCGAEVARAAGGFFGMLGTIHSDERAALDGLRERLGPEPETLFRALRDAPPAGRPELPVFDDEDEITESVAIVGNDDTGNAPAGDGAKPRLRILEGLEPAVMLLENPTSIGRQATATLSAPDDTALSRQHCHLRRTDGRWYVVDLGSHNGTYVNGERILERRLLGGEVLQAGGLRLQIELAEEDG